jgi:hypothetical protein
MKRLIALLSTSILCAAIAPLAAGAQVPTYARDGGETIHGTIASIDGKYEISVHDDRGYVDRVSLHDGTIINPTGLNLEPGQAVTIEGRAAGATFVANEIDTPYAIYPYPYAVYPYPAYRYGVRYRGPGFSIGFRG